MDAGLRLQCRPSVSQEEMATLEVVPQTVVNMRLQGQSSLLGGLKRYWCVKNRLTTLVIP